MTYRYRRRCREKGQNTLTHSFLLPSSPPPLPPLGKPNWKPVGKRVKEVLSQKPAFCHKNRIGGAQVRNGYRRNSTRLSVPSLAL